MSTLTVVRAPVPAPSPPLALTPRGRRVVAGGALLLLLLLVGALTVLLARPVGADPVGPSTATTTVVVGPGDSLWDIAEEVAPGLDPRQFVHAVERRNGVDAGALQVGAELVVPTG